MSLKHRHEDDPSCEILWCFTQSEQYLLNLVTELQRIESWEDIPLEFHWLAVNSVKISVFRWNF